MHSHTVHIQLASIEIPKPELQKSKGYVTWGAGHSFMATLLKTIRKSTTAAAMLGRKAAFIAGEGLNVDKKEQPELAQWLKKVAARRSLRRIAKDAAFLEAFAWQVQWAGDGKSIAKITHQRIEQVAFGPMNDAGRIEEYYICRDWTKLNKFKPQPIPAFDPDNRTGTQLFVYVEEGPGQEYYPELSYQPGIIYMELEAMLADYHHANVGTNFALNIIVTVHKAPEDETVEEEQADGSIKTTTITKEDKVKKFEEAFKKRFTGKGGQSIMFVYGDGTEEGAEKMLKVQTVQGVSNAETYNTYTGIARQAILSAGQVTSPFVVGLPDSGGLGSGQEYRQAYEMYDGTVAQPWKSAICEALVELFEAQDGVEMAETEADTTPLSIVTSMPVKEHFSQDILAGVLTDDEIRQAEGYQPVKVDEPDAAGGAEAAPVAVQTEAQKALSGSVGGQTAIDAMLQQLAMGLTTRESCVQRLVIFFGMTKEQAEAIVPDPSLLKPLPATLQALAGQAPTERKLAAAA